MIFFEICHGGNQPLNFLPYSSLSTQYSILIPLCLSFLFVASLELRLTGAYQVRYNIGGHASLKKENYTFRMKTNQKHAIIMKALGYRDSKDKIKIEIRNSRLFVTYNNGGELVCYVIL